MFAPPRSILRPYKEAAEVMHLSVGTIDNQLVVALKKLAAMLYYSYSVKEKKS